MAKRVAKNSDEAFVKNLIAALASNSSIYKGTAEDATKIVRLALQILNELDEASATES